ncbi:MAG TPA: hypothetical protein VFU21_11910 [Kofleriaceae bacterium]|nr:hypothetical protein [Kofleriaceae bacterium]
MGRGTGAAIRLVIGAILAAGAAEIGVLLAESAHRAGQTDILVSLLGVAFCFFILLCLLSRRRAV